MPTEHQETNLLEMLVQAAMELEAETLLLFPGREPAVRLADRRLKAVPGFEKLHFRHTEQIVNSAISPEDERTLDSGGDMEAVVALKDGRRIDATIFYGGGSHHLVLFLKGKPA